MGYCSVQMCTTILDDLMIELDVVVGHDPWQEEIPKSQKQASEDVANVWFMWIMSFSSNTC